MIKVHTTGTSLIETPFIWESGIQFFTSEGIIFTDDQDADLIVSGNLKHILGLMMQYGQRKKYLLWSIEPRWCKHFDPLITSKMLPDFHVLNLYTGILDNNYLFVPNEPDRKSTRLNSSH